MIQDQDILNARILIIDDSQRNIALLETMLSDAGYTSFVSITDPRKTMSLYTSFKPDLIILDINMPDMDGYQVMKMLQSTNTNDYVPVLVITAQQDKCTRLKSLQSGAKDFLTKPYDTTETVMRIRNMLEVRLLHNQTHDQNALLEQKIRERTKDLSDAQRIAQMGNWVWDIVSNKIHWSDEIYRIFGLNPREFDATYDRFMDFVHPDDKEVVRRSVNDAIYESAPYKIEHRIVLSDGTERIVHEQAEVTFDENGKPLKMIGTVQDITDLKKREDELIKAQKLDSIGILAGGIAHDFNNYLQGIMGYILLAQASADDGVKKLLKEAEKLIFQSKELSSGLITFSKGGDPIRKTILISQLIKDSIALAMSASRFNCQIAVPDSLWPVDADKGQLGQVFSNIIINAKQAMPDGGKIEAFAENIEVNKSELYPLKEGKYVKVVIKDRGTGISHEDIQKIFDPYFTTKKSGNGLGLSTCFSISKKHGGHIDVESEPGVGTTFYIYLPASMQISVETEESGVAKPESTGAGSTDCKGKILVMDDEKTFRAVIREHLKLLEYDVELAEDGNAAISLYKKALEIQKPFDAVVMDLMIPGGMGGKEAVEELLKIDTDAKAIITSCYVNDTTMSEYKKFGFRSALSKPYEIADLDETLQKVISEN
ncbi:MAG: response regulator [Candidatus Brocadiales bacterium]|nr:response regulator [Candidatus Brocadiales bacterium]